MGGWGALVHEGGVQEVTLMSLRKQGVRRSRLEGKRRRILLVAWLPGSCIKGTFVTEDSWDYNREGGGGSAHARVLNG